MNNRKICVSVCAETAGELIAQIKRAENSADIIEIRFDCLNQTEINSALQQLEKINCRKSVLATFRPKEEGGKRQLTLHERINFFEKFLLKNKGKDFFVDFEIDLHLKLNFELKNKIVSTHDFSGIPDNLDIIFNLLTTNANFLKIAAFADDISDSIPIWKLIERAKSENRHIIPIAMGEAGKWTRILGLAHGAFMTYAALDDGQETAPGQVSAQDLIKVYRAKQLNEQTEIYGIVGGNTSYSMSPFMQNTAFKYHHLNAVFVPLQVQNLDEFIRRMVREETREIELNFKGFAVTIPHKQAIIKHLDFCDETAKTIGAVNTVKIVDGKLHGFNTDAHGFITPLLNTFGDVRKAKVAVFGAGGAARACLFALKQAGAEVTIFARNVKKAKNLAAEFKVELRTTNYELQGFDIIINATPLGTKGELENETIATSEQIESVKLIYDLVYNPFQTKLMSEADKVHVPKIGGMAMLVAQGMKQFEIWTGKDAPMKEMSQAVLRRLD